MGLTAIGIVYSPWGRQSGAHFNPSVTLTFLRLGKIAPIDALFYIASQFVGATAAVALVSSLVRTAVANPAVNYVATVPGLRGSIAAFAGEMVISFGATGYVAIYRVRPRYISILAVRHQREDDFH